MISAVQALELLKQSGHMDCDTELAYIVTGKQIGRAHV